MITIKEWSEINQKTGSVYKKCASRTLKVVNGETRKQAYADAYFGTFSELEQKTDDIAADIVVINDTIYETMIYYFGPSRAFNLEKFTEWCIHGGEEDESLGLQKAKKSLEDSDNYMKIIVLSDIMVQAMHELYEVDWQNVDFSELEVLEPVLKPILNEFGIAGSKFKALKPHMEKYFQKLIPRLLGETA